MIIHNVFFSQIIVCLFCIYHVTNHPSYYSPVNSFLLSTTTSRRGPSRLLYRNHQPQPEPNKKHALRNNRKDEDMVSQNDIRISTAGKIGTMKYQDPTRIFVGNLNYTVTAEMLKQDFFANPDITGWTSNNVNLYVSNIQLVTDWKTKQSKGYAFVTFTQPIYSTYILYNYNNYEFYGRKLSIKAANQRLTSRQKRLLEKQQLKKMNKELMKQQGIQQTPETIEQKFENPQFLQSLDPDLIQRQNNNNNDTTTRSEIQYDDDDAFEFEFDEEEEHDEEFEYDEEEEEEEEDGAVLQLDDNEDSRTTPTAKLNREQRRQKQRQQPKKKPTFKGFGNKN